MHIKSAKIEYHQFEQATKETNKINSILEKLLERTNSSRVSVNYFHNGTHNLIRNPFFYYSMLFEKTRPGLSNELDKTQRIPIGIDESVTELIQQGCVSYSSFKPDSNLNYLMSNRGISSLVRCPMFDIEKKIFGFISLEFVTPKNEKQLKDYYPIVLEFGQIIIGALDSK